MTAAVLRTRHLNYTYPDGTIALSDVNLTIEPGQIVAVLGPSGAGKSTLFRSLAGLVPTGPGMIELEGLALSDLGRQQRRQYLARLGLVFQEFHLVDNATVLSNVLIGRLAQAHPWLSLTHLMRLSDRQMAIDLISQVGLAEQSRKRADALSGGQRQRVALARALAQQPTVLLADEPVANLDPALAAEIVDDIVRMVRGGRLTAVLNLHDVNLARLAADRLIGLRGGLVQFDRPTESVPIELIDQLYVGRPGVTSPALEAVA